MPKRKLTGVVVSNKANKTASVLVERSVIHPRYNKIIKKRKKYAAHDENNATNVGDVVTIIESAPISRTKKWMILDK